MEVEHAYVPGLSLSDTPDGEEPSPGWAFRHAALFSILDEALSEAHAHSTRLDRPAHPKRHTNESTTAQAGPDQLYRPPSLRDLSTLKFRLSLPTPPSDLASGSFDQARTFPPFDEPSFESFRNLITSMETTPLVQPSVRSSAACFAVCWGGRGGTNALPAGELRAKTHRTPLLLFVDSLATRAFLPTPPSSPCVASVLRGVLTLLVFLCLGRDFAACVVVCCLLVGLVWFVI